MDFESKEKAYQALQVFPGANSEVVEAAYKALKQKYGEYSPSYDPEKLDEIEQAYKVITDVPTPKTFTEKMSLEDSASKDFEDTQSVEFKQADIQDFINYLYDRISAENFKHNPAKAKIYQKIYDKVIRNLNKIQVEEPYHNSLWRILKAQQANLTNDEFQDLKHHIAELLEITDLEADKILQNTEVKSFDESKIAFGAAIICGVIIALVFMYFVLSFISPENAENISNTNNSILKSDKNGSLKTPEVIKYDYKAKIYDIGGPVNIRSAPSTIFDNVVDTIDPNTVVEVIKHRANGWYYIQKGEKQGFIYGGLLEDNEYPSAYPLAEVIPDEIKVVNRENKVFRIVKKGDRFVIFFRDGDNYYLKSEKGNLFGVSKKNVELINPSDSRIEYITEAKLSEVEAFAHIPKDLEIEEHEIPEDQKATLEEEKEDSPTMEDKTETQTQPVEEASKQPETVKPIPTKVPNLQQNQPVSKPAIPQPIAIPTKIKTSKSNISGYTVKLKTRLSQNYNAPVAQNAGTAVVSFKINKSGSLDGVTLLQSSGNKAVDTAAVDAVRKTAPFEALPDEFDKDSLNIQINFNGKN